MQVVSRVAHCVQAREFIFGRADAFPELDPRRAAPVAPVVDEQELLAAVAAHLHVSSVKRKERLPAKFR